MPHDFECAATHLCKYIEAIICRFHYDDVIMGAMTSQITSLTIVYSTVYSVEDQRKHQSSAPLNLCVGNSPGPVNSPHKGPVTRKMFPFDDVIMHRGRSMHASLNYAIVGWIRWLIAVLNAKPLSEPMLLMANWTPGKNFSGIWLKIQFHTGLWIWNVWKTTVILPRPYRVDTVCRLHSAMTAMDIDWRQ